MKRNGFIPKVKKITNKLILINNGIGGGIISSTLLDFEISHIVETSEVLTKVINYRSPNISIVKSLSDVVIEKNDHTSYTIVCYFDGNYGLVSSLISLELNNIIIISKEMLNVSKNQLNGYSLNRLNINCSSYIPNGLDIDVNTYILTKGEVLDEASLQKKKGTKNYSKFDKISTLLNSGNNNVPENFSLKISDIIVRDADLPDPVNKDIPNTTIINDIELISGVPEFWCKYGKVGDDIVILNKDEQKICSSNIMLHYPLTEALLYIDGINLKSY